MCWQYVVTRHAISKTLGLPAHRSLCLLLQWTKLPHVHFQFISYHLLVDYQVRLSLLPKFALVRKKHQTYINPWRGERAPAGYKHPSRSVGPRWSTKLATSVNLSDDAEFSQQGHAAKGWTCPSMQPCAGSALFRFLRNTCCLSGSSSPANDPFKQQGDPV